MQGKGLIHVYRGYGKGKTTAALGLAVRASGRGLKVFIVQFLKEIDSGEIGQLEKLDGITIVRGKGSIGFTDNMTEEDFARAREIHNSNLRTALGRVQAGECDLLILDEALDAIQMGLLDEEMFGNLVRNKPDALELVITGHKPIEWVDECADYVTEMVKRKHPYDQGIYGRRGIEF